MPVNGGAGLGTHRGWCTPVLLRLVACCPELIPCSLPPPPCPLPQTNEAFWNSVSHAKPLAVGLNCALGATDMKKYIANLAACADCFVFCYPNAGLPNAMGGYDQKGPAMAEEIRPFCDENLVNGIGGCCGSTPEHIAAIRAMALTYKPRKVCAGAGGAGGGEGSCAPLHAMAAPGWETPAGASWCPPCPLPPAPPIPPSLACFPSCTPPPFAHRCTLWSR